MFVQQVSQQDFQFTAKQEVFFLKHENTHEPPCVTFRFKIYILKII